MKKSRQTILGIHAITYRDNLGTYHFSISLKKGIWYLDLPQYGDANFNQRVLTQAEKELILPRITKYLHQSFNPDAAATSRFLPHAFRFLVSPHHPVGCTAG